MELTLFRTVRECLLNVLHHSGSQRANVSLRVTPAKVRLEVHDRGRGFPARRSLGNDKTFSHLGVGLMGMAERIRQLGGNLSIKSNGRGTTGATVTALIPLKRVGGPG
jgi:signal transduction histidine kinase